MAKKAKKKARSNSARSIVERIRKRVEEGGDSAQSKYCRFGEPKKVGGAKVSTIVVKLLGAHEEMLIHFFTTVDGEIRVERCSRDRALPRSLRRSCELCKKVKKLRARGKKRLADRQSARFDCAWNAIQLFPKIEPYEDADGAMRPRIFEHRWTIYERLGDLGGSYPSLFSRSKGKTLIVKKIQKGKQTKYVGDVGKTYTLTPEERKMELWDLAEEKMPREEDELRELIGLGPLHKGESGDPEDENVVDEEELLEDGEF